MSWLISDSSNANSTGHLSTYDSSLYYNQDSWRLCKNMMWVDPTNQKWQQSFDLDRFYSTDKDFGFNKKFNGFTFNTSAEMLSLSQAQGSLPDEQESYKNISSATLYSKEEAIATQKFYKSVAKYKKSFFGNFSFTANCDGVVEVSFYDDRNVNDTYAYLLKNGSVVSETDSDNETTTLSTSYVKGDKIQFKVVLYSGHSPNSSEVDNGFTVYATYDVEDEHVSYYTLWYIAGAGSWSGTNVGEAQNGPVIILWRYKRTVTENGYITLSYETDSTIKTYYAVYVGGVLSTSFISQTVHDYEDFEAKWSNAAPGSEIIFYERPYFDGTAPKKYLEDEVYWVMEYCGKNNITSWDTNFSYFRTSSNDWGGVNGYYTDTYESGDVVTVSKTFPRTVSRSGYKLTDATSSVKRLPKINGLPYKGTAVRTPVCYSDVYVFISPNVRHRKSGHFVVTKDGTISVKCALQSLTAYINSYDNYQQISPSVAIMKNGDVVASYSNLNETKSYTKNIAVLAGDFISVMAVGIFTQNSYYELDYDYEVTDNRYLTGDKDETSFTMYKSSYNSSNTPAYDMAFIVSEEGLLEWTYNDSRGENTSTNNDGILNIFVNGERQVRADSDNVTSSGTIWLSTGDVVLIRYCTHSCSVGNKDEYAYVERGWDTPGGQCTISFRGETVPAAFNHTLSWIEYCKLILAEARLWVDDNSLTDYALPVAIIDDAGDLERTNQFYTELSDSRVNVDLWASVNTLTNLNLYYVKCFNVDMKGSPIPTALFEGKSITQVRIKDATSGIRAFKNTTKKIDSLELVGISGDWTEAFRNSVSNNVKIGKFTTSGLTSAKDMFRGCEIRGTWKLDEDKLKAFFNDTYNKWVAGEYNFRSAFVGYYHSGTIPEIFMSAEEQFACNWDPATLIQKVASTYDVSRLPLTDYYFAGGQALSESSPIYEKDGQDAHFGNYPNIIIPEDNFWKWGSVFAQVKDCYDCALFSITENNKANFNVDVYTSGDERQVNYNYDTSFKKAVEANEFDNLILHLRKVENVTNKSISIEGMFNNIQNLHCVGEIKNIQDITSAFNGCSNITEISTNLNNVEIADYAFKDCHSLTKANVFSNSCYTAMHMFENCDSITDFDIKGMTALIDATSMFEGCTALKTDCFTKATKIPETLQVAKRMFAKCNISEISGNWVPPNSYTSYRNQDENGLGNMEDDFINETTKEGWSFPEHLYSAYQMFAENPITKISNLKFNPNANNSWVFQNCHDLTTIKYSFLDVDAYENDKCTGMFDGCSLKKENVIWLPISISSEFDLGNIGFADGSGNEKPSYWIVDDHWCEVDHSGFVEYQHIRRPAYLDIYRKNYDENVIIKFWSHPHIHSAEARGYNELHDTKVYYDPETLQSGTNYNEWLKVKQTK